MKRRSFLFVFLLILSQIASAQKEANNWNFGLFAGLDFNSGIPIANNTSVLISSEGCSSISDVNGNLLFYTNGKVVYTKENTLMPNGNDIGGDQSSTQSSLIVRQPSSDSLFFIFTSDSKENSYANGYRYSIVNMAQNGGLGTVTSKNNLIYAPSTEKLTAALHSNNKDIWILTHELNTNNFKSFLLTDTGLNLTPVITSIGAVHTPPATYGCPLCGGFYYMKTSADSKRVALITFYTIQLFDFDNTTGVLSNVISIPAPSGALALYGLEFSPDGSKLYMSTINNNPSRVYQYDLTAGDAIDNSKVMIFPIVGSTTNDLVGAMQNGPDGKMYLVRPGEKFVAVINNPNATGLACDYVDQGVTLLARPSGNVFGQLGLPNFPAWYFRPPFIVYEDSCSGHDVQFSLSRKDLQGALWNFGDPTSGVNNTASSLTSSHVFSTSGTYTVSVVITYIGGATVSVSKEVNIVSSPMNVELGNDTLLCNGESLELNSFQNGATYQWNNGSTNSSLVVSDSGIYEVKVNVGGCIATDSIKINYHVCCADGTIIPNLITPNGDGLNDYFYVGCLDKTPWKLVVFNRWGEQIYLNENYGNQWNAEGIGDGVYYFTLTKGGETRKGWLQIIR